MKNLILSLFITFLSVNYSIGQHCSYDNASVILIEINKAEWKSFENVEISLVKRSKLPYSSELNVDLFDDINIGKKSKELYFGRNEGFENTNLDQYQTNLPFAKGCYALVVAPMTYRDVKKDHIKDFIKITYTNAKGVKKRKFIRMKSEYIQSICKAKPIWDKNSKPKKVLVSLK